MAIEWLAGNRLRGTTAERPNFGLPSGSVGGWDNSSGGVITARFSNIEIYNGVTSIN